MSVNGNKAQGTQREVRASVALLRKTHKTANRVKYALSNPTSTLRAIACNISPNVRDVFGREGMKAKSLSHGYVSSRIIFLLAKALKKRLAVNRPHPAAFQVVVAAIEHCARACKVLKISSHGVLNELAHGASGVSRQLVELRL